MIAIVDYGMGNLGSIRNMFKRIGVSASITGSPDDVLVAEKLVLPGVGAFDAAMRRIQETGLREVLEYKAQEQLVPVLGICLGMQLLTRGSEEGRLPGMGWVPAQAYRFRASPELKVPHMGWNLVTPNNPSPLIRGLPEQSRFYFVHSYYVSVDKPEHSILRTRYSVDFDSAFQFGNIFGAQFHPEKSHKFGMLFLNNFAEL